MASKATDPDGLTIKQRAFVQAYVGKANGNGFKAAKLAGYSGSDATLKNAAHKLLKIPKVAAALRGFAAKVEDASVMDARERQRWLTKLVRGEVTEPIMIEGAAFELPARLRDRLVACDQLNKMTGVYSEKREHEHKGLAEVRVYLPSNGRD